MAEQHPLLLQPYNYYGMNFFYTNQVYTGHLTPHMYMYNVIDQQTYTNNAPKSKALSTLLHVLPI